MPQLIARKRSQQRFQNPRVLHLRIEPKVVRFRMKDHRHTVVILADEIICIGRDDHTRLDDFAFSFPPLPKTSEGERLPILLANVNGLFLAPTFAHS